MVLGAAGGGGGGDTVCQALSAWWWRLTVRSVPLQVKVVELPGKTPVCSLVPDAKLGMVMCLKLWQVSYSL